MSFELKSPAVGEDGTLPDRHTCGGEGISPPLAWEGEPEATASYALVVENEDAGDGERVHWLLYHLYRDRTALPPGIPAGPRIFGTASQGQNDFDEAGYTPPCAPGGETRSILFTLYALDGEPDLGTNADLEQLSAAVEGRVLGKATLRAACRG